MAAGTLRRPALVDAVLICEYIIHLAVGQYEATKKWVGYSHSNQSSLVMGCEQKGTRILTHSHLVATMLLDSLDSK